MYQSSVLNAALKIIFFVHLIFITWGLQSDWAPTSYFFYNTMFLLILLWSLHQQETEHPILMAFWMNIVCIFLDVVNVGVFFPSSSSSTSKRFSAGMAIVNLLLRPISTFFLYKILQDRNAQFGEIGSFDSPNLGGILGPGPSRRGPYEDMDRPDLSAQPGQPAVVGLTSPVH